MEDANDAIDRDSVDLPHEIVDQMIQLLFESESYSAKQTRKFLLHWFEATDTDCGWKPLADDNIVSFVTNGRIQAENVTNFQEKENISDNCLSEQNTTPSASAAFEGFMIFKNYILSVPELSQHHAYFQQFENLLQDHIKSLPTSTVYLQL